MNAISTRMIKKIKEVEIGKEDLSFEEFIAIVKFHARLRLSETYINRISKSRALVEKYLEEGRAIYGVTTGFGDNVKYTISREDSSALQNNLLRSHACSVGEPLSEEETRAIILMIILNTGKGFSGIKTDTIRLLCELLNFHLHPFAPGDGSVGYLSVEAHICLTLIGEGFFLVNGEKSPSKPILQNLQLFPVELGCKEGLSLISGTACVTALSLLSLYKGMTAFKNIQLSAAIAFDALRGTTKAFDAAVHDLKKHQTQQIVARHMQSLLAGSKICRAYREEKVQDPCLLRTIPQVLGSSMELLFESYETLLHEFHSVSDNPVIFPEDSNYTGKDQVYMTGNFDGSYVGTHCDMLAIAYANLGNFAERCTDRLVNHHISNSLPPFLITNPGLNNGFMIPQYTQAALQNQLKLLAVPASVDSIPTCAGQEDLVSMAYQAARKANQSAMNLIQMTGILLMTATQALDITIQSTQLKTSPVLGYIMEYLRNLVPFAEEDRYLYQDMELFINLIGTNEISELAEEKLNIIL